MKRVMIRCPETGVPIPTGLAAADQAAFACTPVFMARAACALCGREHGWFAREAWVEDEGANDAEDRVRLEPA